MTETVGLLSAVGCLALIVANLLHKMTARFVGYGNVLLLSSLFCSM
jgi:hypothetical protein